MKYCNYGENKTQYSFKVPQAEVTTMTIKFTNPKLLMKKWFLALCCVRQQTVLQDDYIRMCNFITCKKFVICHVYGGLLCAEQLLGKQRSWNGNVLGQQTVGDISSHKIVNYHFGFVQIKQSILPSATPSGGFNVECGDKCSAGCDGQVTVYFVWGYGARADCAPYVLMLRLICV